MATPFDTLFANTANGVFPQQFGETVSLKRGGATTTGVTAQSFRGQKVIADKITGFVIEVAETCEWIIAVTDYATGSTAVDPRNGDYIVDADSSQWEVLPIDDKKCCQKIEGDSQWLIRTKKVV